MRPKTKTLYAFFFLRQTRRKPTISREPSPENVSPVQQRINPASPQYPKFTLCGGIASFGSSPSQFAARKKIREHNFNIIKSYVSQPSYWQSLRLHDGVVKHHFVQFLLRRLEICIVNTKRI
ncbi:hypothetical protein RDI58_020557 [Solanum bulbocastanum]|uniref:Uncharacterized protein n=1 Tax=Solanum bulbocastanum TaxID=147425 RepID=A0AAN8TCC4_SOLBU